MSYWTYVHGTITVMPIGNTRDEKDTVLDNVLASLPHVSGSEGGMTVYAMSKTREACKISSGKTIRKPFDVPTEYIIVVEGSLRDRHFDRTLREFTKWMCRLAKRIEVSHTLVEISDHRRTYIIDNNNCAYSNMYVEPSWFNDGNKNWSERHILHYMPSDIYTLDNIYKAFVIESLNQNIRLRPTHIEVLISGLQIAYTALSDQPICDAEIMRTFYTVALCDYDAALLCTLDGDGYITGFFADKAGKMSELWSEDYVEPTIVMKDIRYMINTIKDIEPVCIISMFANWIKNSWSMFAHLSPDICKKIFMDNMHNSGRYGKPITPHFMQKYMKQWKLQYP